MANKSVSLAVENALGQLDTFPSYVVKAAREVTLIMDRATITMVIKGDKEAVKSLRAVLISKGLLPREVPSALALPEIVRALSVLRSC